MHNLKQKIIQNVWNIWQQQIHQDIECKKQSLYKSAIKTHITPEGLQKLLTFAYLILQIDAKDFKYSTDTQNHNHYKILTYDEIIKLSNLRLIFLMVKKCLKLLFSKLH